MNVTSQKIFVGVLGLALFASVIAVGVVDVQRRAQAHAKARAKAVANPKLEQGRLVYEKFSCLACHGADGKGGVPNPNAQTGQKVPPVEFVAESFTTPELRDKILKGVAQVEKLDPNGPTPPLHMPAYQGMITDTDMGSLINYLRSLMPAEEATKF